VLQRPLTDTLSQAIPFLQRQGVKVVVEIDDDFESISPRNVSWHNVHPSVSPRRNYKHLRAACEVADLVVVSTPALAGVYGRHGRVVVVPNCVPEVYLWTDGEPHDGPVRIGWSGSTDTHPDDLQQTRGAVGRVARATGAEVHVVGTGKGVQRMLQLPTPPHACGWQPIDVYPAKMAAADVGIVPLEMSRFNEAKSWLKGLEFAALGVPFIASPTTPYAELVARGAGLLASTPKQWEGLLKRLVRSADDRAELAAAGRDAAAGLTIEGNVDRWLDAWESVVNTRAAVSVA
jgi:glycosyltransferase involved in cell wall biosynthesis